MPAHYTKYHREDHGMYICRHFDPEYYLHGFCHLFAPRLFLFLKNHGIKSRLAIIINEEGLVHCFVLTDDYHIDVRGTTDNKDLFFGEFDDFFDYKLWEEGCDEEDYEENILFFDNLTSYQKTVSELTGLSWQQLEQEDSKKENLELLLDAYKSFTCRPHRKERSNL